MTLGAFALLMILCDKLPVLQKSFTDTIIEPGH